MLVNAVSRTLETEVSRLSLVDPSVESRRLRKNAWWCAVISGLLAIMSALNCFPPVDVKYKATSTVLLSKSRLAELKDLASADAGAWEAGEQQPILLMGFSVLDDASGATDAEQLSKLTETTSTVDDLLLVEVRTQWQANVSDDRLETYLGEQTLPESLSSGAVGRESIAAAQSLEHTRQVANWRLKAAKHYLTRHRYLQASEHSQKQTASSRNTPSFSLASHRTTATAASVSVGGDAASEGTAVNDIEATLESRLLASQTQASQLEERWEQQRAVEAGALKLAQASEVTPASNAIPLWIATSIIVIGLSCGLCAGWFEHRIQAGNIFDARRVARQLAAAGVPTLGTVTLNNPLGTEASIAERAVAGIGWSVTFLATNGRRIAEWGLWFWVCIITLRLVLDPMWRTVLLDSPLAALGRTLVGLP
ncbi:MAG TPA: hypothetical protein DDW52_09690 [Planctomycetaceae bacterium]|nr:hypothetical protein [Planctomycetaceae bacterium]